MPTHAFVIDEMIRLPLDGSAIKELEHALAQAGSMILKTCH